MLCCIVWRGCHFYHTLARFASFFVSIAAIPFCHNASILMVFSAVSGCVSSEWMYHGSMCVKGEEREHLPACSSYNVFSITSMVCSSSSS